VKVNANFTQIVFIQNDRSGGNGAIIKMWIRWENAPKCNLCGNQEVAISSMEDRGAITYSAYCIACWNDREKGCVWHCTDEQKTIEGAKRAWQIMNMQKELFLEAEDEKGD
jgi:hypothetical protein